MDTVKLEGAGRGCAASRALLDAGHPGDGPHRPHAAVGPPARRLQGAGPDRRRPQRLLTTRSRSKRPAASPSCSKPCRTPVAGAHHAGARRSRPSASAPARMRRPGARLARHARPDLRPRSEVRQAVRRHRARHAEGARSVRRGRPRGPLSRSASTRTPCPTISGSCSRPTSRRFSTKRDRPMRRTRRVRGSRADGGGHRRQSARSPAVRQPNA